MTDVERFFLLSAWQLPGRRYARIHHIPYLAEYHTDVYNFSALIRVGNGCGMLFRSSRLMSYLYHQLDIQYVLALLPVKPVKKFKILVQSDFSVLIFPLIILTGGTVNG